jgi:hypothetical protein
MTDPDLTLKLETETGSELEVHLEYYPDRGSVLVDFREDPNVNTARFLYPIVSVELDLEAFRSMVKMIGGFDKEIGQ